MSFFRRHLDLIVFLVCGCAVIGFWLEIVPGWAAIPLIFAGAAVQIHNGGGIEAIRKELRK